MKDKHNVITIMKIEDVAQIVNVFDVKYKECHGLLIRRMLFHEIVLSLK